MTLLDAERTLQNAQRSGDVNALDELLHARCVGLGPDGSVFSKEDDLANYRSGRFTISSLDEDSLDVQEDQSTGVTRLLASVEAVQDGTAVSARLLYTRLWVRTSDRWQVLAATLVPASQLAEQESQA